MDPLVQFKEAQKVAWSGFAVLENYTGTVSPRLVKWAGITKGHAVLDVACGTGVAGLSAARLGARVTGVDLTPELIAQAKEHSALMNVEATWLEGDAEALPVPDQSFDVVISQFGHIFAPRPEAAIKEILRVLKPGGTFAFTSWPPELYVGRSFMLMGKYAPPPPAGVSPPVQWGDPQIIRERLGSGFKDVVFTRDTMWPYALSPQHFVRFMETSFGPAVKLFSSLEPAKADALRRESQELVTDYFDNNMVKQDYLLTRAIKA